MLDRDFIRKSGLAQTCCCLERRRAMRIEAAQKLADIPGMCASIVVQGHVVAACAGAEGTGRPLSVAGQCSKKHQSACADWRNGGRHTVTTAGPASGSKVQERSFQVSLWMMLPSL